MSNRAQYLKLTLVALALSGLCFAAVSGRASGNGTSLRPTPPPPAEPFSPSNARTEDGKFIPVDQFFPAARCAACHQDTHAAWSQSLHRNAARDPFYRESADILLRSRGIEFTRHCESCHTPVALFSGALSKTGAQQQSPFTPMDNEGVSCSVCHSITEARLDGTGSYTIRRPALLAKEDGTPIYGDVTDAQILADIPGHKRAVMRPLLRQPEFCATCHKVDAPPELNGYKHIRGFSAYDDWQQSGASRESVTPFYPSEQRMDCRACHMPKIESLNDRAAKNGVISSHLWLGANTATPAFYGQTKQVSLVEEFLENKVLSVDIFALKREATGEEVTALLSSGDNHLAVAPGEEVTADVVVANRKAAHSFPPEVRDLYEAWVEFEVIDAAGGTIFHSGFVKADQMLDESAHVYKTIILDEEGRPITRHQIWTTNVKAYDNAIPAGRSDIVRFRFRVPKDGKTNIFSAMTLRARVNYRRFNEEYLGYIQSRRNTRTTVPVVRMAEAEVHLAGAQTADNGGKSGPSPSAESPTLAREARRWNDYGIGLLEQAQYGPAADAFRRASELVPSDPNYLISAAVAEMRTERFAPEREQFKKATVLLDQVLKLDPASMRARFYRALIWRSEGKSREAADELRAIAAEYPRDREVQRQLGQTLYALGRVAEARSAFEAITAIDPTDFAAYQFLAPLYRSEGRAADADRARTLYLQWRDDPLADAIAARFFAANPQWADERITAHTHGDNAPPRPVLTGLYAAPDR